ncbi:hypothetical protein ACP275_13G114200 [Erythranthe tilingii]
MPEKGQFTTEQVSGKTALILSVAGIIIGGPLVALMGIIFAVTMTLLLVASPLFIIFSPVLFGAACVFGLVMLGLAAAGAMAVVGVSAVAWVLRPSYTSGRGIDQFQSDKLIDFSGGGDVVEGERGKDWAGYIQQRPLHI